MPLDWMAGGGALLGGALSGIGDYLGAQEQKKAFEASINQSETAKAWSQLLGLDLLGGAEPGLQEGMSKFMEMMGALPGMAEKGTKQQLGQLAGAETGAINKVMQNLQAAQGGVGQSAASKGFYGSSVHGGVSNQMIGSANQSVADIMGGMAGAKAGVIGQGTAQKMAAQQNLAQAQLATTNKYYDAIRDKVQLILQTGNAWEVDPMYLSGKMGQGPHGAMYQQSKWHPFQQVAKDWGGDKAQLYAKLFGGAPPGGPGGGGGGGAFGGGGMDGYWKNLLGMMFKNTGG